ncbi:hypothetical protein E3N88_10594 [Mikania micrantha]|uniref:Uncharacterized protein n=1 Tax=Mikania micrantha TaxID=192012 RepID=A0A5N6PBA5_9ASTR|nr:hypothetical protein E3N88_10594 [Mikania micrantha]
MDNKVHLATTVSNIKNQIPITLESEIGQYGSWSELFRIHCKAHQVHDHLLPKPINPPVADADKPKADAAAALWERLDSIVLQWIYDNKSSRAIYLNQKFSTTRLENFSNMSAYCQAIKMIVDQLANVGKPIDNQTLVLQLITGLTEQYEGIAMLLQQTTPLPDFYDARSRLCMEETRKTEQTRNAAQSARSALTATTPKPDNPSRMDQSPTGCGRHNNPTGRGRPPYTPPPPAYPPWNFYPHWSSPNYSSNQTPPMQPWNTSQWSSPPPCPYPSRPPNSSPGLLERRIFVHVIKENMSYTKEDLEATKMSWKEKKKCADAQEEAIKKLIIDHTRWAAMIEQMNNQKMKSYVRERPQNLKTIRLEPARKVAF